MRPHSQFSIVGLLVSLGLAGSGAAQVATDGTVGPRVELGGPDFQIGAELGTRAGGSLFHSFERFSVRIGESATFSGPDEVRNVISRVTGGARSDIDGRLASTIPGADFYFLNPAGVLFGPNATLDVQGSFHVSTADELRFADGAVFSATDPAASSLTIAAPEAFGFLGGPPSAITVDRSSLEVPAGEAISLVGGGIEIVGGPNGFIEAEAGAVTLAAAAGRATLEIASGALDADERAGVSLADQALVDVSGDGGGMVRIQGGVLVVDGQSSIFAANTGDANAIGGVEIDSEKVTLREGSRITADALSTGGGGHVKVMADQIEIRSGSFLGSDTYAGGRGGSVTVQADRILTSADGAPGFTGMGTDVLSGRGQGGTTTVRAGSVELRDGALIRSSTFDEGNAGVVSIRADELQVLSGGQIASDSEFFATGNAGKIEIAAGLLRVADGRPSLPDGGQLTRIGTDAGGGSAGSVKVTATELELLDGGSIRSVTFRSGSAGDVQITAKSLTIDGSGAPVTFNEALGIEDLVFTGITTTAALRATGNAGSVAITADDLEVRTNGTITSDTFGPGRGGRITVTAKRISIVGAGTAETENTGITSATALSSGNAGDVVVSTGTLEIREGGEITTSTVLFGQGQAGTVTIHADSLLISGDGSTRFTGIQSISDLGSGGNGGNIIIAAGDVEMRDGGQVTVQSSGSGESGRITFQVIDSLRIGEASITAETAQANANDVTIAVGNLLDLNESAITTSVAGGIGGGGNIVIDPRFVILDNSSIIANAREGAGGNIRIVADNFIASPDSEIRASSELGIDGTVEIVAPDADIAGDLVLLDVPLRDAAALLRERCAARRDVGASSFTGVGQGGLPRSPDQPLLSEYGSGAAAGASTAPEAADGPETRIGDDPGADPKASVGRLGAVEVGLLGAPTAQGALALVPVVLLPPCTGAL